MDDARKIFQLALADDGTRERVTLPINKSVDQGYLVPTDTVVAQHAHLVNKEGDMDKAPSYKRVVKTWMGPSW